MFYRIARACIKAILTVLWRPRITGASHIDECVGGAILIANHAHLSDILALAIATKRTLHFVGKSELFRNPFINWLFRSLGAYPINRKTADVKAIKTTIAHLQKGEIAVIFPEGHRSEDGTMQPFLSGAAFIALQCKASVVPAYIRPHFYRTRAVIDFGPAIALADRVGDMPKAERVERATALMFESVADLRDEQARRLALPKGR